MTKQCKIIKQQKTKVSHENFLTVKVTEFVTQKTKKPQTKIAIEFHK